MNEQRSIVDRWRQGQGLVLATLVHVQGSSYRRPGARLLICKDGSYVGSISAGCLEADLLRKAAWLCRDGAAVERYSTLFDEGADVPYGLGCGGVLDILLEPVETPECDATLSAMEATLCGKDRAIATWLPAQGAPLKRAVLRHDGAAIFSSPDLTTESISQAKHAWSQNAKSTPDTFVFERLISPQRLFIFGAGDDAWPLASMAMLLGWSVTVADGRTHLLRRERFPEPQVLLAQSVQAAISQIERRDAVVVMTHSFEQDGACLTALLPKEPRYLGLLGARQRSSLLIDEAAAVLGISVSECCDRLSAPTGLDLGGDGPEAIALAIIAEAQAVCSGKAVASRKLSAGSIQQYLAERTDSLPRQTQCALDVA